MARAFFPQIFSAAYRTTHNSYNVFRSKQRKKATVGTDEIGLAIDLTYRINPSVQRRKYNQEQLNRIIFDTTQHKLTKLKSNPSLKQNQPNNTTLQRNKTVSNSCNRLYDNEHLSKIKNKTKQRKDPTN